MGGIREFDDIMRSAHDRNRDVELIQGLTIDQFWQRVSGSWCRFKLADRLGKCCRSGTPDLRRSGTIVSASTSAAGYRLLPSGIRVGIGMPWRRSHDKQNLTAHTDLRGCLTNRQLGFHSRSVRPCSGLFIAKMSDLRILRGYVRAASLKISELSCLPLDRTMAKLTARSGNTELPGSAFCEQLRVTNSRLSEGLAWRSRTTSYAGNRPGLGGALRPSASGAYPSACPSPAA